MHGPSKYEWTIIMTMAFQFGIQSNPNECQYLTIFEEISTGEERLQVISIINGTWRKGSRITAVFPISDVRHQQQVTLIDFMLHLWGLTCEYTFQKLQTTFQIKCFKSLIPRKMCISLYVRRYRRNSTEI